MYEGKWLHAKKVLDKANKISIIYFGSVRVF